MKKFFDDVDLDTPDVYRERKATVKQIEFAKYIADFLRLPYPNFDLFNDTSEFISHNKDKFYAEIVDLDFPDFDGIFDDLPLD